MFGTQKLHTAYLLFLCLATGAHASHVIGENTTYASLVPAQEAQITSPMNGLIQKIYYHPGESFQKGAVLVEFDCHESNLLVQRAAAELKAKRSQLDNINELMKLNAASNFEPNYYC